MYSLVSSERIQIVYFERVSWRVRKDGGWFRGSLQEHTPDLNYKAKVGVTSISQWLEQLGLRGKYWVLGEHLKNPYHAEPIFYLVNSLEFNSQTQIFQFHPSSPEFHFPKCFYVTGIWLTNGPLTPMNVWFPLDKNRTCYSEVQLRPKTVLVDRHVLKLYVHSFHMENFSFSQFFGFHCIRLCQRLLPCTHSLS